MTIADRLRVPPEQLRWKFEPTEFDLPPDEPADTSAFPPGQTRAVRAMEIGLALRGHGYNIFVAGDPGTADPSDGVDVAAPEHATRRVSRTNRSRARGIIDMISTTPQIVTWFRHSPHGCASRIRTPVSERKSPVPTP